MQQRDKAVDGWGRWNWPSHYPDSYQLFDHRIPYHQQPYPHQPYPHPPYPHQPYPYQPYPPNPALRVRELCESRGGRPGLPVLMSLMPYGFCVRKATLNNAHALVTVCSLYANPTPEDIQVHVIITLLSPSPPTYPLPTRWSRCSACASQPWPTMIGHPSVKHSNSKHWFTTSLNHCCI